MVKRKKGAVIADPTKYLHEEGTILTITARLDERHAKILSQLVKITDRNVQGVIRFLIRNAEKNMSQFED